MHVTRFEPWSLMNLMHRDLDQIARRRIELAESNDSDSSVADWTPAVDIVEEKDRFVMRADIPGVNAEDIDINMENGVLSVSGERHLESGDEIDGVRRIERRSGKFYRRFTLPEAANAEEISAQSANGILEVSIPKQPQIQARRITVEKV
jgi:HSP20 family protein